jgi:hypothetical protein
MIMAPESLLFNKLVTVFPGARVAVAGDTVYHQDNADPNDPIPPYVLYRRTSTIEDRDLQNNLSASHLEFDVSVGSMFFNQVDAAMPDNWVDSGWYFALSGQSSDQSNFEEVFSYEAHKAW